MNVFYHKCTVIAVLVGCLLAVGTQAQEPAPRKSRLSASVDYASKYVWRGQLLTDGAVLQPAVGIGLDAGTAGSLGLGVWGSMDVDDVAGRENQMTEYNWNLYFRPRDMAVANIPVGVELGTLYYYYPNDGKADDDSDSFELYVKLFRGNQAEKNEAVLKPFLNVYYEGDDINGWYVKGGSSYATRLSEKWGVEAALAAAWGDSKYNRGHFGLNPTPAGRPAGSDNYYVSDRGWTAARMPSNPRHSGWNDVTAALRLLGVIDKNTSTCFSVNYSEILDSDLERNADVIYGDSNNFWFAWNIVATF
jgi:uncharacterized protein (TIGR02001 family)